mgnify:CR=1 FL=1
MNNLIFITIILFFMYLFYHSYFLTYKENFDKRKQIILLGDSILENSNYVEKLTENVESNIKKKHPHVLNLAQDHAVINNLTLQMEHLKQKKINKDDIIFVSVGGNDILNRYRFKKKGKMKDLNLMFEKYAEMILRLKNTASNQIVLLNIYAPPKVKKYHNIIVLWNKKQKAFASENNIKILDIHSLVNHESHFIKNIEPSHDGGRIIANAIINSI